MLRVLTNNNTQHRGLRKNWDVTPFLYKRIKNNVVIFLVSYVNFILLIGNNIGSLMRVKIWLAKQFNMKNLGEASYVLRIQILRDRKNRSIALS